MLRQSLAVVKIFLTTLYQLRKIGGTHEHQNEIKDVKFNIELYSTEITKKNQITFNRLISKK